ncbi:MAG TPA: response regulator [Victivallales bacterium]|nr:response regulator [Victivallales bacterium]
MSEKKKILIVDDDKDIRNFFSQALISENYEIFTAENGDRAIEIMRGQKSPFSLAVIDFMMPHRTGWDLIEHIRTKSGHRKVPIIVFTGLLVSQEMIDKIQKECFVILQKGDFDLESFKKIAKEAIESGEK